MTTVEAARRAKAAYHRRHELHGYCRSCVEPAVPGKRLCEWHVKRKAYLAKRWRQQRKALGFCTRCYVHPKMIGQGLCSRCYCGKWRP